jgi:hypothetical protein
MSIPFTPAYGPFLTCPPCPLLASKRASRMQSRQIAPAAPAITAPYRSYPRTSGLISGSIYPGSLRTSEKRIETEQEDRPRAFLRFSGHSFAQAGSSAASNRMISPHSASYISVQSFGPIFSASTFVRFADRWENSFRCSGRGRFAKVVLL